MHKDQQAFLENTHDILVGYDGCGSVAALKTLIDEARQRISFALRTDFAGSPAETDFESRFYKEIGVVQVSE